MDTQKPLLIFILDKKADHPSNQRAETSKSVQRMMKNFRIQAEKNRLCRYWSTSAGLLADVVISLYNEIKENPQLGWVRSNVVMEDARKSMEPQVNPDNNTDVIIEESWQVLLRFNTLEPGELDEAYNSVLQSLTDFEYTRVVPLAVITYTFSFLKDIKKLSEEVVKTIRGNFFKVLSSCNTREELYEMKLDYSKAMNQLCFQKKLPEELSTLNGYFYEEFNTLWKQMRDKMTIALEDITDETALMPMSLLQESVPDHSVLYEWADIFDKVNISKMVSSIVSLSNKGRSQLASFFIERYKLRYYMEKGHQSYARSAEVNALSELSTKLSEITEQSVSTTKLSYQYLANVVEKAKQRADGNTNQLMTFNE